jgi:competence protein ComEC
MRRPSFLARPLLLLAILSGCALPAATAPEFVPADSAAPTATAPPVPAPPASASAEQVGPGVPAASGMLVVTVLDVGQGDAMLLQHEDVTVLIDTGRFDRTDVVPALRARGVSRLDLVIVTHPHADHIGQFDRVLAEFPVTEVWWSGAQTTTATFGRALAALEASDARYAEPRAGATTMVGPLQFEILHPGAADSLQDLNESSISLRITFGDFRLVTTGDAQAGAERSMLARQPDRLAATVLRLGHHGSSTSTTVGFLERVDPAVAIYSAGAGNQYGHPHAEVLDRLRQRGVRVYGTDVHGDLTILTDGEGFDVRTQR